MRKLVRRECGVTVLAKPGPAKLLYGGTFYSGTKTPIAMCAADLAFAAYAGAALSMLPGDVANDQIKTGALDEILEENYAEVLNVLARIFVVEDTTRMTLLEAIMPPKVMPSGLVTEGEPVKIRRADYEIKVTGYGKGTLALWGVV